MPHCYQSVTGGVRVKEHTDNRQLKSITTDELFTTLSNRRRRYVLHYMKQHTDAGQVPIRDLSEQLAAWENGVETAAVNPKQRKRIYSALHQTHLPKMDRLGIVDYDRNRGTVTMTDSLDQFDIYFGLTHERDLPWSQLYLGLGAVATTLAVCVWLSVWPFELLPDIAYAMLVSGLFLAVSGYHVFHDRQRFLGESGEPPEIVIPGRQPGPPAAPTADESTEMAPTATADDAPTTQGQTGAGRVRPDSKAVSPAPDED